jgi:hypothetical protein
VAEIHIPTGPLDEPPPFLAIRPLGNPTYMADANHPRSTSRSTAWSSALTTAPSARLAHYEPHTVATSARSSLRARAAETEGKVVLDEVDEIGITDEDGSDVLWPSSAETSSSTHGTFAMDADEAEEWARHLATMARALRQQAAARGDS